MVSERNRTMDILRAAVAEYIRTGEPVSSDELYRRYGFGVKPATIRNELLALTEKGYLAQPHTSGGRVPTDKGYYVLVETVFEEAAAEAERVFLHEWRALEDDFLGREFENFVHGFSESFGVLGIGYDPERGVMKSGLSTLVHEIVGMFEDDVEEVEAVVRDFDTLDERMHALWKEVRSAGDPSVFIGRSPITRSKQLSVIADRYAVDGDEFLLAAVGPKRMDYGRCIRFFRTLKTGQKTGHKI